MASSETGVMYFREHNGTYEPGPRDYAALNSTNHDLNKALLPISAVRKNAKSAGAEGGRRVGVGNSENAGLGPGCLMAASANRAEISQAKEAWRP